MSAGFIWFPFFCFAIATITKAQPIINFENMSQVGSSTMVAICSDQPSIVAVDAQDGPNQVWDYTTLNETYQQQQQFLDPTATTWASRYPNASLCTAFPDSIYEYYHLSADSLSMFGAVQIEPNDTLFLDYQDPELFYMLPCSYGVQQNDTGTGNFLIPFETTTNVEADGYGTLMLPNATYQNVVRIHAQSDFQLNVGEGSVTDRWTWFSSDHEEPLLTILNVQGAFQVVNLKVWYNKTPQVVTSIKDHQSEQVSVFPNPYSDRTTITFNATDIGSDLIITDLLGKVILQTTVTENQIQILASQTGNGAFLCYLESAESQRAFVGKLVVVD